MDIVVAELLREFRRSQNEAARSISYEGTIIQLERPGDHTRFHDLIKLPFLLLVRLRIQGSVLVILHRHSGHLFLGRSVLVHMHCGHEGKQPRKSHTVPLFEGIVRGCGKNSGYFWRWLISHLLNASDQHDVVHAGLDRHYSTAKSRS